MVFIRHLPQDPIRSTLRNGGGANVALPSYALKPLLRRLRDLDKPRILDLGSADGPTLEFFAVRGCRVWIGDLTEVLPVAGRRPRPPPRVRRLKAIEPLPPLLRGRCPAQGEFDAVLCWDLIDLLLPEQAAGLVGEIRSRQKPGGLVWALFDSFHEPEAAYRRRVRVIGEQSLDVRVIPDPTAFRTIHQNRDVLAMFEGYEVVRSTFLRVGLREMLFARAAEGGP
ncbi:MAG: class I SAM-dependent methyltransferase [Acidobacteriota bacterium]